ncbi:alpha/beta hydrolase [Actinokineospora sp. HUAS TT18]|uniref:alpha/beta hydrolase n=1 Tax=Actinokineospora sp. HUAS TT18 TaxID=3447451 RepID=UPI003F520450
MPRGKGILLVGVVIALTAGVAPIASADAAGVPRIAWQQCPDDKQLHCAMVPVPLDYADPRGKKISLRLVKRVADKPNRKIGTVFINNGGPGGSAADFVTGIDGLLGAATQERFDIVGIDPRGIGGERNCLTAACGSEPVVCAADPADPPGPARPAALFPRGPEQVRAQLEYEAFNRALCDRRGNEILDHMSSADTARDMDLMRRAVGDRKLNFYGISYGSVLGATYAAMYPNNIRTMIVDAVLDPVAWSTGRGDDGKYLMSARLGSEYGAWESLHSAFAECDRVGPTRCPAAGKAAAKFYAVSERLKQGDVEIPGGKLNYQEVMGTLLGALYAAPVYPAIMEFVEATHQQIFGTTTARATASTATDAWTRLRDSDRPSTPTYGVTAQDSRPTSAIKPAADQRGPSFGIEVTERHRRPGFAAGVTGSGFGVEVADHRLRPGFGTEVYRPAFEGVACADGANPNDPDASVRSAAHAEANGPGFGELWSWATSPCVNWPGSSKSAYRGPWKTRTSTPLLIVGNLHDPATPISGARALNGLMGGSRLLTLDGWGHGALGASTCVTTKYAAYFVNQKLPAPGSVCQTDAPLFPATN